MNTKRDVLLVEDRQDQMDRIAEWLGLAPFQYAVCQRFAAASPTGRHPNEEAQQGWRWIESELRRVDPKVVVLDYLLSKELGNVSFDGIYYGNLLKAKWPELGVVVVTTGGDDDLAGHVRRQEELDEQRKTHKWTIDAAWLKPWGTAASSSKVSDTRRQVELRELITRSRCPSEHRE